jgi:hypothetical protein
VIHKGGIGAILALSDAALKRTLVACKNKMANGLLKTNDDLQKQING